MIRTSPTAADLLDVIVEHIDIPKSLYEKAAARHRSLADHLKRDSSAVAHLNPDIRPQGSFRFGTVIRPINADDEYDLDNVCVLTALTKGELTQQQLKALYGEELKVYAREHGMLAPVEECNRCWRLRYADEVSFHLDSLPCVPEDPTVIARLMAAGVYEELARRAVAITDRRHPQYAELSMLWLSSNPRGFARWFESRAALGRRTMLAKGGIRATIEDVPPYEWKTPLQRAIQILKRHRDVMFRDQPELAPISMIITNLAAHAYEGEDNIAAALTSIVAKMPTFVRKDRPRVPNPADLAEDYADKWARDSQLENSFWQWYYAVKSDLERLSQLLGTTGIQMPIERMYSVTLTQDEQRRFGRTSGPAVIASPAPAVVVPSAPKPWAPA